MNGPAVPQFSQIRQCPSRSKTLNPDFPLKIHFKAI